MVKRWEAPGQPSPSQSAPRSPVNYAKFSWDSDEIFVKRYVRNTCDKREPTTISLQTFLRYFLWFEKFHFSFINRLISNEAEQWIFKGVFYFMLFITYILYVIVLFSFHHIIKSLIYASSCYITIQDRLFCILHNKRSTIFLCDIFLA